MPMQSTTTNEWKPLSTYSTAVHSAAHALSSQMLCGRKRSHRRRNAGMPYLCAAYSVSAAMSAKSRTSPVYANCSSARNAGTVTLETNNCDMGGRPSSAAVVASSLSPGRPDLSPASSRKSTELVVSADARGPDAAVAVAVAVAVAGSSDDGFRRIVGGTCMRSSTRNDSDADSKMQRCARKTVCPLPFDASPKIALPALGASAAAVKLVAPSMPVAGDSRMISTSAVAAEAGSESSQRSRRTKSERSYCKRPSAAAAAACAAADPKPDPAPDPVADAASAARGVVSQLCVAIVADADDGLLPPRAPRSPQWVTQIIWG